jgi:hypothetical protein
MTNLKQFVVMATDQDGESTVVVVKAESQLGAFKKYLEDGGDIEPENVWMTRMNLNDNPLMIGEVGDSDYEVIDFEGFDGNNLEDIGVTDPDEDEDVCDFCGEPLKTVMAKGVGKTLTEKRVCSNPDCEDYE